MEIIEFNQNWQELAYVTYSFKLYPSPYMVQLYYCIHPKRWPTNKLVLGSTTAWWRHSVLLFFISHNGNTIFSISGYTIFSETEAHILEIAERFRKALKLNKILTICIVHFCSPMDTNVIYQYQKNWNHCDTLLNPYLAFMQDQTKTDA